MSKLSIAFVSVFIFLFSYQILACVNGSMPPSVEKTFITDLADQAVSQKEVVFDDAQDFYDLVRGSTWTGKYYSQRFKELNVSFSFDQELSPTSVDPGQMGLGYVFNRQLIPFEFRASCFKGAEEVFSLALGEKEYREIQIQSDIESTIEPTLPKRHIYFPEGRDPFSTPFYYLSATVMDVEEPASLVPPYKWVRFPTRGGLSATEYTMADGRKETVLIMTALWSKKGGDNPPAARQVSITYVLKKENL